MIDHALRAGLLALTLALCALTGGCDSQAAVRPAPAAVTLPTPDASESLYPEASAPFDETPITPVETVGAARSE